MGLACPVPPQSVASSLLKDRPSGPAARRSRGCSRAGNSRKQGLAAISSGFPLAEQLGLVHGPPRDVPVSTFSGHVLLAPEKATENGQPRLQRAAWPTQLSSLCRKVATAHPADQGSLQARNPCGQNSSEAEPSLMLASREALFSGGGPSLQVLLGVLREAFPEPLLGVLRWGSLPCMPCLKMFMRNP